MQNLAIALSKEARIIEDKEERKRYFRTPSEILILFYRIYERSATYFQRVHTKDTKNKYLLFHWGTSIMEHLRMTLSVDPSKGILTQILSSLLICCREQGY